MFSAPVLLVLLASLSWAAYGLLNITVDDTDSAIVYAGNWDATALHPSRFDYGGAHRLSEDHSASATFTFTGVGVYFLSPLWPYRVTTQITLDSGIPEVLDLVDHGPNGGGSEETVQSDVVWSRSGLANTLHTVVASIHPGDPYVVVDGFIYTILDPPDTNTSSSTSPTPSSPSSSSSSTSSSSPIAPPASSSSTPNTNGTTPNRTLAIALGGVFGAVGIAIIVGAFLFCRRRPPSTPGSTPWTLDSTVYPAPAEAHQQHPNQMTAAYYYIPSPVNSAYFSQQQGYSASSPPYAAGQGFDPTHNYNHSPPRSYYDQPAAHPASYPNNYAIDPNQQNYDPYDDQHQQWHGAATPRTPNPQMIMNSGPYPVNTLSMITETSAGPYGTTVTATTSPSPGSEFGGGGYPDRMSVGSETQSVYVGVAAHQQKEKERELTVERSRSQDSEDASGSGSVSALGAGLIRKGTKPPAYLP